jgi:hypothetical protein
MDSKQAYLHFITPRESRGSALNSKEEKKEKLAVGIGTKDGNTS